MKYNSIWIIFFLIYFFLLNQCEQKNPESVIEKKAKKNHSSEIKIEKQKENPYSHLRKYEAVEEYLKTIKGEEPGPGSLKKDLFLKIYKTNQAPKIDGKMDEIWDKAKAVIAWDPIAKKNIIIKAMYTNEHIFFLVSFMDQDESRAHKTWQWNEKEKIYEQGTIREDTFVLKWNMNGAYIDLSIFSDNDYKADIWFWKADRTDPSGFADDKIQILSSSKLEGSNKIINKKGKVYYLKRSGDTGTPAYKSAFPVELTKQKLPRFIHQKPKGSRADIKAKGLWEDKKWTIEFQRNLTTGNIDDIQFTDLTKKYQFGVSCLEIAGRYPLKYLSKPLYGSGDTYNNIYIEFN